MRILFVTLLLIAALPFTTGCNVSPAVAQQQPRGHEDLEIKAGTVVTVAYSANGREEIKNAGYIGHNADWFVITVNGRHTFIPIKNILRIDLGQQ